MSCEDKMKPPKEIVAECPICGAETAHDVLGGRVEGKKKVVLRSSVRCCECGHVHSVELSEDKPIEVPTIISWMDESKRASIALQPHEIVSVDDEIFLENERLKVTSIESGDARVRESKAKDVDTIWAKKFDKVRLKVSVDLRGKVLAKEILAVPEEEFAVGEVVEIDRREFVITSIRTQGRTLKHGSAKAGSIVRIYSKGIRSK